MFTHHVLAKSKPGKPGQSAICGDVPSFLFSSHSVHRSNSRGALMQ
jgi:hypothetical protein